MNFCGACGKSLGPADRFCGACGKLTTQTAPVIPPPSPLPQSVEEPVPMPPHPNPPQRRSHIIRNMTLIGIAIAVVGIAIILLSGPSPEDSLEKAGAAYLQQDTQAFDNYVDVRSILEDWTDQAATSWLINNNSTAGQTLVANGLAAGFKAFFVPQLARSVEQEILSGRLADHPQTNNTDDTTGYIAGFVSNGVRSLVATQLKYQGIASQTKSGSDAVLDVQVGSPVSSSSLIVKVKMQRAGDHWRIVAIQDVAGLMRQLNLAQH